MANSQYGEFDTPSWISNSAQWNKPLLGGIQLPGMTYLRDIHLKNRTANNKAHGEDSGSLVLQGLENPNFEFELHLFTDTDERNWSKLSKTLLSKIDPKNRGTYSVYHPSLARMGITGCVVHGIGETPPHAGSPLIARIQFFAVSAIKGGATKSVKKTTNSALDYPATINTNFQRGRSEDLLDINNPLKKKVNFK